MLQSAWAEASWRHWSHFPAGVVASPAGVVFVILLIRHRRCSHGCLLLGDFVVGVADLGTCNGGFAPGRSVCIGPFVVLAGVTLPFGVLEHMVCSCPLMRLTPRRCMWMVRRVRPSRSSR